MSFRCIGACGACHLSARRRGRQGNWRNDSRAAVVCARVPGASEPNHGFGCIPSWSALLAPGNSRQAFVRA
eukprot:8402108-Lingulodinium_polyedra.AAC.1